MGSCGSNCLCLPQVCVIPVDPILPWRCKDIEIYRVFEGFGGVRKATRNHEHLPGADGHLMLLPRFAECKAKGSLGDPGDLFIGVLVPRDRGTALEIDTGEHGLLTGDELAGQ